MVAREILLNHEFADRYELVGFLDDDAAKTTLLDKPVLGTTQDAAKIIVENHIDEVIIAIPSAGRAAIQQIVRSLPAKKVSVRIVPGLFEIIQGSVKLSQVRPFESVDLLGREEVGFDRELIEPFYKDKTVFVTGAGGSIGSELVEQLLDMPVKAVIGFGHGENSIHNLIVDYTDDPRFRYVIGDVRDVAKLRRALETFKPQIVFHAAAHKHVPLMEDYPDEAVKTNIDGTYNLALAAVEAGVERFVLISTDKAVKPASVMGATKRVAERIMLAMNAIQDKTHFLFTRFGNVLGSQGSVLPVFEKQIRRGGPVTVTDPESTRFFMSIREAARLVVKACTVDHGEVFLLDMGEPVKIIDLARNMIRMTGHTEEEIPVIVRGLRKGEKIHEETLTEGEKFRKSQFDKLLVSECGETPLNRAELSEMLVRFRYAADHGDNNEIRKLLKEFAPDFRGEAQ